MKKLILAIAMSACLITPLCLVSSCKHVDSINQIEIRDDVKLILSKSFNDNMVNFKIHPTVGHNFMR